MNNRIDSTWGALEEVPRMFWTDKETPFMLCRLTCDRAVASLLLTGIQKNFLLEFPIIPMGRSQLGHSELNPLVHLKTRT